MANMAKELVKKGAGTDIVRITGGDIDRINQDVVLKAAEEQDEPAVDLVKRSALALGMRAAYLANMFDAGFIILGGGIERKEGNFAKFVKESAGKFLLKKVAAKAEIALGVLGERASSVGVASLCRRKLFMEVV